MAGFKIKPLPKSPAQDRPMTEEQEVLAYQALKPGSLRVPDTMAQAEIIEKMVKTSGLLQDIEMRKEYAGKAFKLIIGWIVAVFILILLGGVRIGQVSFQLSEKVFLTILGGTTLNILSIFIFVMKYLFDPKRK
jgi:hypothetical protein